MGRYGILTQAHNTIMLDGQQQVGVQGIARAPIPAGSWTSEAGYDTAFSSTEFEDLGDATIHTRGVYHDRETGLIAVVDRVTTPLPRQLEAFWHAHPDSNVTMAADGSSAFVRAGNGATLVVARDDSGLEFNSTCLRGQVTPSIQGWYSRIYSEKAPSPVAVFETRVPAGVTTLAWVLRPAQAHQSVQMTRPMIASANATGAWIVVEFAAGHGTRVFVPLA